MGLFSGGLFGGGGSTGFSGGGIGSSANQTANSTENRNNATSGENSDVFDSRGGTINVTDAGIVGLALDFVGKSNAAGVAAMTGLTTGVLNKQTLDSGERVQNTAYAAAIVAAILGGLYIWKRA